MVHIKTILKKILNIFAIILVFLNLKACFGIFYYHMTHLSEEDLTWVDNPMEYSIGTFRSDSGHIAQLTTTSYEVNDTRERLYFTWEGGEDEFQANARYYYEVTDSLRTLEGDFFIKRLVDNDTLAAKYSLGAMYSDLFDYRPMKPVTYILNNDKVIDNCIIVDTTMVRKSKRYEKDPLQQMSKFVISRDYGLIYYQLESGEQFFRELELAR